MISVVVLTLNFWAIASWVMPSLLKRLISNDLDAEIRRAFLTLFLCVKRYLLVGIGN